MKNTYTKELGAFDHWDAEDDEIELHEFADSTPFHVGQEYVDQPVPMFKCKSCGGTEFNVGSADYFTAIRCPKCGWESCIHEG